MTGNRGNHWGKYMWSKLPGVLPTSLSCVRFTSSPQIRVTLENMTPSEKQARRVICCLHNYFFVSIGMTKGLNDLKNIP